MSKCEWISIRDQLPPIGKQVLFCCKLDDEFTEVDLGEYCGKWSDSPNAIVMELPRAQDDYDWSPCSHWMELPKTPELTNQTESNKVSE